MKHFISLCASMALVSLISCDRLFPSAEETSSLVILFDDSVPALTRAMQIPEVDDFNISVTDSEGKIVFSGRYSSLPEKLELKSGSYSITAESRSFESPCYDAPQYGDSKVVKLEAGKQQTVLLQCSQLNCGLRLFPDASFKAAFPSGSITMRGPGGNLLWDYSEKGTAFFAPGSVSLLFDNGKGESECLCTRTLEAASMLSIKLSVSDKLLSQEAQGIVLQLDTTRNWISDTLVYGGDSAGSNKDNPYNVTEARQHIGEDKVWVQGYIIGLASSSSKLCLAPPFLKNTNIVIGLRSSTINPEYCICVELPLGDTRDALNLVDNPSLKGKKVLVCGKLVASYYGLPGLKNVCGYSLK